MKPGAEVALGAAIVGDTFRNLVGQFSQELCFYRELIQNALDAGSRSVDVDVTYDRERAVAVAAVSDLGCGMDGDTIDTQLTRLFSSSKEDDRTKIGKFGIGFVSVFAVEPVAVVVETGRGGESWRVIFQPDGSFERMALDEPTEGTRVAVYKAMAAGRAFTDFVTRSRATVDYWCRHAEAEIRFNGERVDVPFDLDAPVKVRAERQGTEIVAALSPHEKPFFGFYNGGITLLEGRQAWIPGVAFKLKSRWLEHTLTRDNVKQDANFEKAMKLLREVVARDLDPAFRAWLSTLSTAPLDDVRRRDALDVARVHLGRLPRDLPFIPVLGASGRLSLAALADVAARTGDYLDRHHLDARGQPILTADAADHVTDALLRANLRIVACQSDDGTSALLEAAGFRPVAAGDVFGLPVPCAPGGEVAALAERAAALLRTCGVGVGEVRFATFDYAGSCIQARPFLVLSDPGEPATAAATALLGEDHPPYASPGEPCVVLNTAHPLVAQMAAARTPALGAYLLAKLLCLADGLHPETERRLLAASLEALS